MKPEEYPEILRARLLHHHRMAVIHMKFDRIVQTIGEKHGQTKPTEPPKQLPPAA